MNTLSKMIMLLVDVKLSDNAEKEKAARMSALLEAAVEQLPELEKRVIKMAYMLEKNNNDTHESLANEFSVPQEKVWSAHANALNLLREQMFQTN